MCDKIHIIFTILKCTYNPMAFSTFTVWYNYSDYFSPEHFTSGGHDYNGWLHLYETLDPVAQVSGDRDQSRNCCEADENTEMEHREDTDMKEMFSVLLRCGLHEQIQVQNSCQSIGLRSVHSLLVNFI